MIGNLLNRGLVMIFGYAYPAYECFKTVEKNKPEIEQLRFWCQYWILVAMMTVFERTIDTFVSWVPMYSEVKLAFIIYLWYPKTKGTMYVYDSFFRPYVSKHETEIDRSLLELRTRAGDAALLYCQNVVSYVQTRVFDILQYVAVQSTSRPRPPQPQQRSRTQQSPAATVIAPSHQPSTRTQVIEPQNEEQPPPAPTKSSTQRLKAVVQDEEPSSSLAPPPSPPVAPPAAPPTPSSPAKIPLKKSVSMPASETSTQSAKSTDEVEISVSKNKYNTEMDTGVGEPKNDPVPSETKKATNPSPLPPLAPPQETVMEEAIRVTRGRLRKARSTPTSKEQSSPLHGPSSPSSASQRGKVSEPWKR